MVALIINVYLYNLSGCNDEAHCIATCAWAKVEALTNTKFLFLLPLQDYTVYKINDLHALVHHFYHYDELASEIAKSVAHHLLQDSGKINLSHFS